MAFEEDLSLFLDADNGFSVQATATTRFAERVQFQVIFDNGHQDALGGLVESTQPTALARTVDVADLAHRCAIDVGAETFVVTGTQPDGTGMTTLLLERAV